MKSLCPVPIALCATPAADPGGRFNPPGVADGLDWCYQDGFKTQRFEVERLIDRSYAKHAATELDPLELVNKGRRWGGCR